MSMFLAAATCCVNSSDKHAWDAAVRPPYVGSDKNNTNDGAVYFSVAGNLP